MVRTRKESRGIRTHEYDSPKQSRAPDIMESQPFPSSGFGHLNPFQATATFAPGMEPLTITEPYKTLAKLSQDVGDIKADLWEKDGLDDKIQCVAWTQEETISDVELLKTENEKLRKDIEMLKSVVIKLDRKVQQQEAEITDLKGRSMKLNILVHNLEEESGEVLRTKIPHLIIEHLGVEGVEFSNIHRNGDSKSGKPRTITGRLIKIEYKDEILKQQKVKKDAGEELPFYITPQSPPQVNETRKKLIELNNKYWQDNVKTRVMGDKLVFPNGTVYKDKVSTPNAEELLQMDSKELEKIEGITTKRSDTHSDGGNQFSAAAVDVNAYAKVRNFYKKISIDPVYGRANHNILIYRFKDNNGVLHEGYCDDGEFGAGRKMLGVLKDQNRIDVAIVISRMMGRHLGPKRFQIMENTMMEALNKLV
ncbi:uncharacterized protein LOC133179682 [Saccostrea echinata]|uniref:uncharacterized protein LOC133179682 n=1 Tax=Saccostrea echinata TaxID=191078 RepID=UPI002A841E13|nr:uncharacterized protein LOC133179682 [Saccostrea echinata]